MSGHDVRKLIASMRLPAMAAAMTAISTPALVAQACAAGIIIGVAEADPLRDEP
jgi:hypothetical protein